MTAAQLQEYLGIVVDMEQSIYLEQSMLQSLQQERRELEKPALLSPPEEPKYWPHVEKDREISWGKDVANSIASFFILGLLSTIAHGVGGSNLVSDIFGWAAFLVPIGIFVHDIRMTKSENADKAKLAKEIYTENAQMELLYREQMKCYEEKVRTDAESRQNRIAAIDQECGQISRHLEESQKNLQIIYGQNIIFPKYRNLVMVSSLYEYVAAKRCSALEGADGGYNILETEIRLDHIITQLDRVISNLEAIKKSQYMLYVAMQAVNQQSAQILESTNRMVDSLRDFHGDTAQLNARIEQLQKSSALNAYHTDRVQKELAYMNRMDYLTGRNDGPFRNIPPT